MRTHLFMLLAMLIALPAIAQTAPPQAAAAGYKKLVFEDEFTSPHTISPDGTGNYKWYTTNFSNPSMSLPASGYLVQNGYLEIKTDASGFSDGLQTANASHTTQAWQHGYFEARIFFCPTCSAGEGWPSFWSYSIEQATGQIPASAPFAELDFMEYYTQGGRSTYLTDVHQWLNGYKFQNSNNVPSLPANTNFGIWHTYGCLWTPNEVRWYFDNKLVEAAATGPGTQFTAIEQSKMLLVLGTGTRWPMYVDFVHVWQ